MKGVPERYAWATHVLDVRPDDHILEIGCGYGQMVALVCERLTTGRITAIDRSSKMVDEARRSNAGNIDSGKAEILRQDLLDRDLPTAAFDKIFLFNINAFWMDPVEELGEVRRLLRPEGCFFIFHQPPPAHDIKEFLEAFKANLKGDDFHILSSDVSENQRNKMMWISSKPNPR